MADQKKEKAAKQRRPSAKKRDIQGAKRNLRNKSFKSKVTTALREFKSSVTAGSAQESTQKLNEVYSLMDKGVKIGVYKINKASRVKSRLNKLVPAKA